MTTENETNAATESRSIDGSVRDLIYEIYQSELDALDQVRRELHEIAKYNDHVASQIKGQTARIWRVTQRRRKLVSP